jgi:hypothetical protein
MKNTPSKKIFQRLTNFSIFFFLMKILTFSSGKTDKFIFEYRSLGELCRIVLGHQERTDYPLESHLGRESQWNVEHITITDPVTNTKYHFPVNQWIDINNDGDVFECDH